MNSRRSVLKGLFALSTVSAAGAACRRPAPKKLGPWLRVEAKVDVEPEGLAAWRGLSLAVRAIPDTRRVELVDEISEWLAGAEARHHPLGIDLEEERPALERVRTWFLPVWNAATALEARAWPLPSGKWQVAAARERSPSGGDARVFRAWEDPTERDPVVDGARFAAWPITNARLVDAVTPEGLARFAAAARARICDAASCLGLFVHRSMLDRRDPCPEFDAVRTLAERARRLARSSPSELDAEVTALLERVPASEPATIVKSWLDLDASEVLVVPRLGALARRGAFHDELRSLAGEASLSR